MYVFKAANPPSVLKRSWIKYLLYSWPAKAKHHIYEVKVKSPLYHLKYSRKQYISNILVVYL